jgi:hypothetical protein
MVGTYVDKFKKKFLLIFFKHQMKKEHYFSYTWLLFILGNLKYKLFTQSMYQ